MAKENNTKKKSTKQNDTFKEEVKETVKKKEVKEKKKTNKDTAKKIFDKVENNRTAIITGIVCFLVATLLFRCILWRVMKKSLLADYEGNDFYEYDPKKII